MFEERWVSRDLFLLAFVDLESLRGHTGISFDVNTGTSLRSRRKAGRKNAIAGNVDVVRRALNWLCHVDPSASSHLLQFPQFFSNHMYYCRGRLCIDSLFCPSVSLGAHEFWVPCA